MLPSIEHINGISFGGDSTGRELHNTLIELHREALDKFSNAFPELSDKVKLNFPVKIELSTRLRSCAGKAHLGKNIIKLHYRLLKDKPDELRSTYLHELAHLITKRIHGRVQSHGYQWKRIAIAIGDSGERCHSMDVSEFKRKQRRFLYTCDCNTHELTVRRHNAHQRGNSSYHCRICKAVLRLKGEVA
jgi:SprT protein